MKTVVIIGLGSAGKKHVDSLLELKKNTIDIFALRNKSSNVSKYKNVINIFDLEELTRKPDCFIVSNPTALHFETIKPLLRFKKPIFIEKPVVMNLTQATKLEIALSKNPVLTYVGCNLRFLKVLQFSKDFLTNQSLRINEINIYGGSYLPNWRPTQDFKLSYSANTSMGGGIHLDFIHEIDYLFWLVGKPLGSTKIFRSHSSLNINAVDYANFCFIYKDFVVSVILNYYRMDRKRTCEIVTDSGTILIEIENGKVYFNQKLIFESEQTILDTYTDQMRYFLDCVKAETKPFNDFTEAFEVLKMCLKNE